MKRGMSAVIAVVLLVFLVMVLVGLIWFLLLPFLNGYLEISQARSELMGEDLDITYVSVSDSQINISIKRGKTDLMKIGSKTEKKEREVDIDASIMYVVDGSGSMVQSGWDADIKVPVDFVFEDLEVKDGKYGEEVNFTVPNVERLLIALDWEGVEGLDGSEASEFSLNAYDNSSWIYGSSGRPNNNGGVDPSVEEFGIEGFNTAFGNANDYYSGICTKPQYIYVENPAPGLWKAKPYGWNFRPNGNVPDGLNSSIRVYFGSAEEIKREETIVSRIAVKKALNKTFANLDEGDEAGYFVFTGGENGYLKQGLTSNKDALISALKDDILGNGGTNIHYGIENAKEELLNNAKNDEKVMIVLTDGQNDAGSDIVIDKAVEAKNAGIKIFTIGLTNFANQEMLRDVASKPEYFYYTPDASKIDSAYESTVKEIIKIKTEEEIKANKFHYFKIFMHNGTDTYVETISQDLPDSYETRFYEIDTFNKIKNVTKIEVAVVIPTSSGEALGPIVAKWEKDDY